MGIGLVLGVQAAERNRAGENRMQIQWQYYVSRGIAHLMISGNSRRHLLEVKKGGLGGIQRRSGVGAIETRNNAS